MNSPLLNIIVSGVGGQGTVLAGKLLAGCALAEGAFVRSAETIGMAQRGGSVLGHVRISESGNPDVLTSPLVPPGQAHLLIGFEPGETLRAYAFCAEGAIVVTATKPYTSPAATLKHSNYDGTLQLASLEQEAESGAIGTFLAIDNEAVMAQLGFDKALNVVLLGAAIGALSLRDDYASPFLTFDAMSRTIAQTVKPQFVEPNIKALETGYRLLCT